MKKKTVRNQPGRVRDAILDVLRPSKEPLSIHDITEHVKDALGDVPMSSIRSYLRLNTPTLFTRESRGCYCAALSQQDEPPPVKSAVSCPSRHVGDHAALYHDDCFNWLREREENSLHAVVTDPPYGLFEYTDEQVAKLRSGQGGVWRIPPSFDGHMRSPLPRFTVLKSSQLKELRAFFAEWGRLLLPCLVPGANVLVASNPLLSYIVSDALSSAGLERRGEIIRLTMTMRGGDRPKAAHEEFSEISVMPRSMWEPWLVYRRPIEGRVQDNLRKWGTGGFRRPEKDKPFGDVIESAPTRKAERDIAPHPSLKPQAFLRQIVKAVLPLGKGVILDPFAGSGSTLAAAEALGYCSIGVERDSDYYALACSVIPTLSAYEPESRRHPYSKTHSEDPVFPELLESITV